MTDLQQLFILTSKKALGPCAPLGSDQRQQSLIEPLIFWPIEEPTTLNQAVKEKIYRGFLALIRRTCFQKCL